MTALIQGQKLFETLVMNRKGDYLFMLRFHTDRKPSTRLASVNVLSLDRGAVDTLHKLPPLRSHGAPLLLRDRQNKLQS